MNFKFATLWQRNDCDDDPLLDFGTLINLERKKNIPSHSRSIALQVGGCAEALEYGPWLARQSSSNYQ
jgi:hypothetical protein